MMRVGKFRLVVLIALLLLTGIIVGYAYLNGNLSINGDAVVQKNTWDVRFTTITTVKNDGEVTTQPTVSDNTNLVFGVKLNKPGDSYILNVVVENRGSIDAMISGTPVISGLEDMASYLDYSVTYSDKTPITDKNLLKKNSTDTIRVELHYKENITEADIAGLSESDVTKVLRLSVKYVQADSSAVQRPKIPCKKALTLHTETCERTSDGCIAKGYANGDTITYGHTNGTSLVNGQSGGYALDCDVSGNGDYERFYYVSDLYTGTENGVDQFDSNYAVLIYHKNIGTAVAYNSAEENWHGPVTLLSSLPTRSTWANENINLKSTSRTIYTEKGTTSTDGGTIENPFNYTGAVARLLTAQEINKSCNITVGSRTTGELDSCEYLMEDSYYSKTSGCSGGHCYYWLETPYASGSYSAWLVDGSTRFVNYARVKYAYGVRQAVEILKSNIFLE